jgi:hypothetical protein
LRRKERRGEEHRSSERWAVVCLTHPSTWYLDELVTALTFSGTLLTVPAAKELLVDVGFYNPG